MLTAAFEGFLASLRYQSYSADTPYIDARESTLGRQSLLAHEIASRSGKLADSRDARQLPVFEAATQSARVESKVQPVGSLLLS
jgi:hypothetical protein